MRAGAMAHAEMTSGHAQGRQDSFAAGTGIAADQAFDIDGWLRGQALIRLQKIQITNPALDAQLAFDRCLVPAGDIGGDDFLLMRGKWANGVSRSSVRSVGRQATNRRRSSALNPSREIRGNLRA